MHTRLFTVALFFTLLIASSVTFPRTLHAASCASIPSAVLKAGVTHLDVRALQQILNTDTDTVVAVSGDGSMGHETNYFGAKTKAAVIKFQNKYRAEILTPNGLATGTGHVGPATLAHVKTLCAAKAKMGAVQGTSTEAVGLVVGMTAQPATKIAAQEAMYVPFTNFTLTAPDTDVEVKSITVRRIGPAQNQAFDFISLFDEDNTELAYGYIKSDSSVIFKTPFTVPANTTMRLTVVGSMKWDVLAYAAQAAGFSVESIDASTQLTGVALPIIGTFQVILPNLAIGRGYTSLGIDDPRGNRTQYVQDTNVRFGAIRVTAGTNEKLQLRSVTWSQNGSAGPSDVANVTAYVNSTAYPTEVDGRYYTAVIEPWIEIDKGQSVEIQLHGDITIAGSNRTLKFDIDDGAYIELWGSQFGYGIFPIPEANTDVSGSSVFLTEDGTTDTDSLTPYFSASTITISAGAINEIGKR
ncbi:MAG: peptidoglycan-binding protein [Patescibacteria group bacterium]